MHYIFTISEKMDKISYDDDDKFAYSCEHKCCVNKSKSCVPLLDDSGQLLDLAALLADDVLGLGGSDDDLHLGRGRSHLDAGIALVGQAAEEVL